MDLEAALRRLEDEEPSVVPAGDDGEAVERSVAYLASDAALEALAADCYWPKWDGPWWQMLLLHERGATSLIPRATAEALAAAIDRIPVHAFPIRPEDVPPGFDPLRAMCHCAMGCVLPMLLACGVDVDDELPWGRGWFARYQMADGGLSCDNDAYLVEGEVPSSMVGTVPSLEAMLILTASGATSEEMAFMDRAAAFLVERALTRGSDSAHNADERKSALAWGDLTFPRFYFYDVLRGLSVLVAWADRFRRSLPWKAVAPAVTSLLEQSQGGRLRIGRRAFFGSKTKLPDEHGNWTKRAPAGTFPLLEASSVIGEPSPFLTRQWHETRERMLGLAQAGLVVD